jgi:ubiquitin-protein ligase E3 C
LKKVEKMFNNFDGDFRRRPVVSIRGASKKESKAELLERTQRERNQREVIMMT